MDCLWIIEMFFSATFIFMFSNTVQCHINLQSKRIEANLLHKDYYAAVDDYNSAVIHGIIKIASKMGISTIQSYQGAKIFEAIGLKTDFINRYFTDTVSRVGGIGIEEIAEDYTA